VLTWTEGGYRSEAVMPRTGTLTSSLFPDLNLNLTEVF
jgi:hypothetical protein